MRDGVVVQVTGLAIRADVLSKQCVAAVNGGDRAQDLNLNNTSSPIQNEMSSEKAGHGAWERNLFVPSRHGCPLLRMTRAAPSSRY